MERICSTYPEEVTPTPKMLLSSWASTEVDIEMYEMYAKQV